MAAASPERPLPMIRNGVFTRLSVFQEWFEIIDTAVECCKSGVVFFRDLELVQMVADLLAALDGKPQGEADITTFTGGSTAAGRGDGR